MVAAICFILYYVAWQDYKDECGRDEGERKVQKFLKHKFRILKSKHRIKYEAFYDSLKICVNDWTVNKDTFDEILYRFKKLGNMKYRDKDKTTDLFVEFMQRFKSEAMKTINEL